MAKERKRTMTAVILLLLALGISLCLIGCSNVNRYQVDYDGVKELYECAKDSYRAGQEVTLYFTMIATDTDYSFYLDGEPIDFDYDDKKGFIIRFTMPNHDVKLECRSVNSMVYIPLQWEGEADVMLIDCYRATTATADGGGYHELVVTTTEDPEQVRLDEYIKEEGGEETCTTVYIPYQVADEFLWLIEAYGLTEWNDMEDAVSLDGAKKVCKFWDGETHIRISTEHMPEDGEETLDLLFEMLQNNVQ